MGTKYVSKICTISLMMPEAKKEHLPYLRKLFMNGEHYLLKIKFKPVNRQQGKYSNNIKMPNVNQFK